MSSARRATLRSALQHPSLQLQEPSKQRKGTKRGANKEAEDERATTSRKQIAHQFKSAKHEPAAAQAPVALKQSQTQQPQINGALTASTESKSSGVSSSTSLPSSSSSSSHNVPCPAGFDAALWAQLTSRPSPVAIPANSIQLTYLHDLLSATECAELVSLASACGFSRSLVNHAAFPSGVSPNRTSSSASLRVASSSPDCCVSRIRKRVTSLLGATDAQIQQLCVVNYTSGQQYKPHCDSYLDHPPLRQYTIFAYLNDVEGGGGETEFTKLGVKFKPSRGDALFWENHATHSSPHHAESEHAGLPPLSGVKYGLNCWIEFGADDPLQR